MSWPRRTRLWDHITIHKKMAQRCIQMKQLTGTRQPRHGLFSTNNLSHDTCQMASLVANFIQSLVLEPKIFFFLFVAPPRSTHPEHRPPALTNSPALGAAGGATGDGRCSVVHCCALQAGPEFSSPATLSGPLQDTAREKSDGQPASPTLYSLQPC